MISILHGVLILNKPQGKTSHDLVSWCRRTVGQKRVGHTGTLDPLATGVLPLCLGEATRLAEYLTGQDKTYRAEVLLGFTSNTFDTEGELKQHPVPFTLSSSEIEAALVGFRGAIEQRPPLYSAISQGGKRLYQLARAGVEVEVPLRPVNIYNLELVVAVEPLVSGSRLTLLVTCSKGTYIRSLAHDLGQRLGCGAVLSGLERLRSGGFTLEESWTTAQVEALAANGEAGQALVKLSTRSLGLPWLELTASEQEDVRHGRAFAVDPERLVGAYAATDSEEREVLLLADGGLRAIGKFMPAQRYIQPHKVFSALIPLEGVE